MANQMWQSVKASSVNDMQEQCDMFTQIWKYATVITNLYDKIWMFVLYKIFNIHFYRCWLIFKEICFLQTNDWDKYKLQARISLLLHIYVLKLK